MRLQRRTWSATTLRLSALVGIGALVVAGCGESAPTKKTAPAPSAPKAAGKPVSVGAAKATPKGPQQASVTPAAKTPATPGAVAKARTPTPGPTAVKRAKVAPKKVNYPPFDGDTITVIHTANMVGEIEPCG